MRITQIIASRSSEAAGPTYSVGRLAESLAARGLETELLSTGAPENAIASKFLRRTFPAPSIPALSSLAVSSGLRCAINHSAKEGAVLHSHGLWLAPNLYSGWSARRYNSPHVLSPRGMLGPAALQFSRLRKQIVWRLAQRRIVESAACLHATSIQEHDEIRALGITTPIAVVPNGIDVPGAEEVACKRTLRDGHQRTLLHLGRIHPKKGVDRLIEAWATIEPLFPDWRLRIVGPSEGGHLEELQARACALKLSRVTFDGVLLRAAKDDAYRGADLFVLPTLNENFGLVVAEALANGVPVICTKGAPWAGLNELGAGLWIDHGVEPLVAALMETMALPRTKLDQMGARGRDWMLAEFSWSRIAGDMEQVYRWCACGAERPQFVKSV